MGSVGMKEHHWGNSLIRVRCSCIRSKRELDYICTDINGIFLYEFSNINFAQLLFRHPFVFPMKQSTLRNKRSVQSVPEPSSTNDFPQIRLSFRTILWEQLYNSCQVSFKAHLIDPLHWQHSKPSGTVAFLLHPGCSGMLLSSTVWQVGFMQPRMP